MRKLILMAVMPAAWLFATELKANPYRSKDSAKIVHVTDGNISEWKIDKFEKDPETRVQYAVDHDEANLYVAMKITDLRIQMRLMSQGMSLYIDKKGKKKESSGVEFPLKNGTGGFGSSRGGGVRGGGDPKEMRERMMAGMVFLRAFGMENLEDDKNQLITQQGMINIAFDWDAANTMYIEYTLPLIFVGNTASLNGKPLSIGWKILGFGTSQAADGSELPTNVVANTTTRVVGVPAGTNPSTAANTNTSRGRTGGRPGAQDFGGSASETSSRGDYIWTKYVLTF